MKIALIYEKFISRGGLENYLYSFANQLITDGDRLEVITGLTDAETNGLEGCNLHVIPRKTLSKFAQEAESLLQTIDADVSIGFGRTVAHDLHRAGGGCHQFYSESVLNPLKRIGSKNRTELALERELYCSGKTRHFVVNSKMVAGQLKQAYGLQSDQISLVRTAVDSEKFSPSATATERESLRVEMGAEGLVYLFVSMNHRRKGLDALLEAWKRVPVSSRLWIVGPELSGRYRRMIERFGLSDRISSFVEPDDLVSLYRAADVFIHPTLYDACANTVLQSMACELPGIISERDGARQFVCDGENGVLLPRPADPVEIAAKVHEMAELSGDERKGMGIAARKTVLPLTWKAHVDRWREVMGQVCVK